MGEHSHSTASGYSTDPLDSRVIKLLGGNWWSVEQVFFFFEVSEFDFFLPPGEMGMKWKLDACIQQHEI